MKTFKSSVRPWFAALFISAGVLCAIWTLPISTAREKITTSQGELQCYNWCDAHNKTDKSRNICYNNCSAYWSKNGSDAPTSINRNPTPSPTPQRYPIKGPPHKLGGSSPTPSATASQTLLDKSAKKMPTPTPTPKSNSHSHHSG
jgi:hypothetical protein